VLLAADLGLCGLSGSIGPRTPPLVGEPDRKAQAVLRKLHQATAATIEYS
jgi:hypothetical protein